MGYLDSALAIWECCRGGPPPNCGESGESCVLSALSPDLRTKSLPPWPPRAPELVSWLIPWRQRWGELSNQFEDEGIPFPESERHAYHQVKVEMAARKAS